MSGFQSSLGEDEGIAEELAESQRAISIAEFFEKNKHMLGFDSGARGLVTAIKEAVDNSLDATEEANILPDIYVEIAEAGDYYKLIVEDNGPGITKEQLPKVFGKLLYGSRFHKREQSLPPDQTLLVREDGEAKLLSIGDLCDRYLPDEGASTQPVTDQLEAPAFTRDSHQTGWEPVTHAIRHETAADTYAVTTELGRTVEVTGNHSLFALTDAGETTEVDAGEIKPGDEILAPARLPRAGDPVEQLNLLTQVGQERLSGSGLMVFGFDESTVDSLPSTTAVEGGAVPAVDIVQAGLAGEVAEQECLIGFSRRAGPSDSLKLEQESNHEPVVDETTTTDIRLPVEIEPSGSFARFLGQFLVSEGVGSAVDALKEHVTLQSDPTARPIADGGVMPGDAVSPGGDVNALTRIASILGVGLCGTGAERRVPQYLFCASEKSQQAFLAGLHGVEDVTEPSESRLTFGTSIDTLRSQVSILWSMLGVTAGSPDAESPSDADHRIAVGPSRCRSDAFGHSSPSARRDANEQLDETNQALKGTDMRLLEVESVEQTAPPEYVYDISVPGANGDDENFVVANDGPISVKNSRGQQGIGISAAVLYSQLTSGKPAKITSRPKGTETAQYFELIIDTDTNEPEIKAESETTWDRPHGTRIELEMEANMRARQQLHDYIQHTAVVNPHARIELREPKLSEPKKFERATDQLPDETSEIRPHPHGVELGTLIKMLESSDSYSLSGFLQSEFTRVGTKTADSVSDAFRDRYFGREFSWTPPAAHDPVDIAAAVTEAVSNKGAAATEDFADTVANQISNHDRIAHHQVVEIVEETAKEVAASHDRTFGATVRENAIAAAWGQVTAFGSGDADSPDSGEETPDQISPDVYNLIDQVTGKRKDDATVTALAKALARRLVDRGETRGRITQEQLERIADDAAEFVIDQRDATIGDTAREKIVTALAEVTTTVPDDPPAVTEIAESRDTASELLEAMQETDILSPPTDCLAPITADLLEAGLRKEFDADFFAAATRDAEVHGGDPFIVEAGVAYGGEIESGSVEVMRFANRVPLVYQRGACATTDVVKQIGWRNYGLDQPGGAGIPSDQAVIMVHIASTNVPFTSESKDAVANVPEIEDEIELAIREASRELKSYLNKRRSLKKRRKKQDVLGRILPVMADKVSEVTERNRPEIDGAMARIMNNLSVKRAREGDEISLSVHNYSDTTESPEVTEILDTEPTEVSDGATAVEMDGEWFLNWEPTVSSGETAELTYSVPDASDFELMVEGVEDEKLTVET
ncbi:MAG: DNA topoisomerase VI, subunit B [uncultured archaeon A07HR60]|nr:MAG: DNA topoisomerase VI, subunit B [uncultured archaeon A07HR60]